MSSKLLSITICGNWYLDPLSHLGKYNSLYVVCKHKLKYYAHQNDTKHVQFVDCHETFNPVVEPTTIRTVLTITLSQNWIYITQPDVNNAFLHFHLSETVFIHQPTNSGTPCIPIMFVGRQSLFMGLNKHPMHGIKDSKNLLVSWMQTQYMRHSLFIYRHGTTLLIFFYTWMISS